MYTRDTLRPLESNSLILISSCHIFAHHCSRQFWYSLHSKKKDCVRGDNKGKRIIIMHAMTKDGLLEVEGVEPSNILTELYHSCALIFNEVCVDNITPADYHDTINPLTPARFFDFRFSTCPALARSNLTRIGQLFHYTVVHSCECCWVGCQPLLAVRCGLRRTKAIQANFQ